MTGWFHDLRYAGRGLLKSPGFTAVAVLTLALGIGANTAIFSVVDSVLLKPLPFQQPERLVQVFERTRGGLGTASPPNFTDWRSTSTAFEEMGAYTGTAGALTGAGEPQRVAGAAVTGGFFPVLAEAPMLGRVITDADAVIGQDRVVVLSHGLWQRQFAADPRIVGRPVQLDGGDYTVIGVMPPGFEYPAGAAIWVPLAFTEDDLATQRGAHYLDVIARLAPGASVELASSQLRGIAQVLEARFPDTNTGSSAFVLPLRDALVGDVRPALLVLLGAVGFVLLIACANVANLLLARTAARKRELAVRSALGAGRARLARHVLAESLLLALLGGAAGLLLANAALETLLLLPVDGMPRLGNTELDRTVLTFTVTVSILTGVLFGLLPALRSGRGRDLSAALKAGGGAVAHARTGGRTQGALVVAEMALAVLLLAGAGLLLKSFVGLQRVDTGFNPSGVLTFNIALPRSGYPQPADSQAFFEEFNRRIGALPGVERVAGIFGLPLTGFDYTISVERLDGAPAYDGPGEERYTQVRVVTPEYFRAMEIPLLAGRALAETDRAGTPPVVVVNESAAELLWPGGDALDHTLEVGTTLGLGDSRIGGTVVGVVGDVRHHGPREEARPEVYAAHAQFPIDFMSMTVRSSVPPATLVNPVREQLRQMDAALPMDDVRSMEQRLATSIAQPRFYMLLLSVFAATALFLAAIGIYGVMACAVRNRVNEIGIRRALGAEAADVVRMVVGSAMTLALGGLAVGLLAAFALTRVLADLLYGVSATDPLTFAGVAILLTAVALLASFIPARRAARVDPMVALREE